MTSNWVESIVRPMLPPLLPVFMLHQFKNTRSGAPGHDPELLDQCLTKLRHSGFELLDLDEAFHVFSQPAVTRHKVAVFTVDDGFQHQVEQAFDVFSSHRCPFTCFLLTDFVDGKTWPLDAQVTYLRAQTNKNSVAIQYTDGASELPLTAPEERRRAAHNIRLLIKADRRLNKNETHAFLERLSGQLGVELPKTPPSNHKPVTWQRARDLERRSVRFGAHGLTHHILSLLDDAEAEREITLSREKIIAELARSSEIFCYPVGRRGDFLERDMGLAEAAGFLGAVSAIPGHVTPHSAAQAPFSLPRFTFPDSMADFSQYVSWIEYVKSKLR
jgi:peptidoglycan/xylan/chitin deacetylase (PgdA/CDA1 family)